MTINVQGLPANIAEFIRNFYTLSDNASASLDEYADQFAYHDEFHFAIGPMSPATSREGVKEWRARAWDVVAERSHSVFGVYVAASVKSGEAASKDEDLMLYGRVDYVKKDGSRAGAGWGGRMVLDRSAWQDVSVKPKMSHYTVWIVS